MYWAAARNGALAHRFNVPNMGTQYTTQSALCGRRIYVWYRWNYDPTDLQLCPRCDALDPLT
jgi:hypothetical protein